MALYLLPEVGHAGLGNQLFPWARAEIFAHQFGGRVLTPRWHTFHVGPYLRGESEKRSYHGFFGAPHHVRGLTRLMVSLFGRRLPESTEAIDPAPKRTVVVEFSGMGDLFKPLLATSGLVRDRLWSMTKPAHRPSGLEYNGHFVGMHLRRGDLTRQGFSAADLKGVLQYTPTDWFIAMARAVSAVPALRVMPLVVFTDGHAEELEELTSLPRIIVHERRSALADLWLLSKARILFASGYSTFSMWASYLGGMPTVYAPGKIQQRVQSGRTQAIELAVAAGQPLPREIVDSQTTASS